MKNLYAFITSQAGWRVYFLGFFLGSLVTLALPPIHWIPFAFLGFSGFYLQLQTPNLGSRRAFWLGWWFGLGHFTTGLYWIAFSMGVEIEKFWWLIPFCVLGVPAILALYTGCVGLLMVKSRMTGVGRWLMFAVLWVSFEWLRGHMLSGFPWNLLGYIWMPVEGLLQVTAYGGIYGLSLLTVLALTAVALVFEGQKRVPIVMSLVMVLVWRAGVLRLDTHPEAHVEGVYLRLVQPNILQKNKWKKERLEANFQKLIRLSHKPSTQPVTHMIGPESAVPFYLEQDTWHRHELASHIPNDGAFLLGAPRIRRLSPEKYQVWNSFIALNDRGEITVIYDKSHLVPFGEYVPFRKWVPSMVKKITAGSVDYSAGPGPQTFKIPGLPAFSPLICYEGIFPGHVTNRTEQDPKWLINVTNDAWYGRTSGPYQHFAITRVRAIEEGVPLIRVANTGISGITDAYGRVQGILALDEEGVLDGFLPQAAEHLTFYARFGDKALLIVLMVMALGAFALGRRKIKEKGILPT